MPRNAEAIRQWTILREIERARAGGVTIDELAVLCDVTTRTIRRDLQALEEAGFPLFDDKSGDDGKTRWLVNGQPFRGLGAGLTLSELSALYFSRTLLASLTGAAFRDEVESAFEKLASVLTPHMRHFLDQMPRVITTKKDGGRVSDVQQGNVGRAVEATLLHRQAEITYASKSSARTKTYIVHPYRLAYAQGGLYLLAYVPEYKEVRTFAVERLQRVSLLEERFEPIEDLPEDAFPHSLGVHSGPPERVEIDFLPTVADYVLGRSWHASQTTTEHPDGSVRMTLDVCLDRALTSWILSFGPFARVAAPAPLARDIAAQLSDASGLYNTGMIKMIAVDIDGTLLDSRGQLPPANRDALADASARGIAIVLATGRAFHFARPVAEALSIPVTLIVNNGAVLKELDGTARLRRLLRSDLAKHVLAGTPGHERSVAVVFDRAPGDERPEILFEQMDWSHPHRKGYYRRNEAFIGEVTRLVDELLEDPIQIMFNGSVEPMRMLADTLRALPVSPYVSVALTEYELRDFSLLDVNAAGCTKGLALAEWALGQGLTRDEVMAVGDNLNDLEMLAFAGTGVVMGNASPAIKARGFSLTESHDDNGLALAIRRLAFADHQG